MLIEKRGKVIQHHMLLQKRERMNRMKIIGSLALISVIIWWYKYNWYAGKYIGFKCGQYNQNNIFILKNNGTFVFKSDNLLDNIVGQYVISEEENISLIEDEKGLKSVGTIIGYNLHINKEKKSYSIPYASGCSVYVRPK